MWGQGWSQVGPFSKVQTPRQGCRGIFLMFFVFLGKGLSSSPLLQTIEHDGDSAAPHTDVQSAKCARTLQSLTTEVVTV